MRYLGLHGNEGNVPVLQILQNALRVKTARDQNRQAGFILAHARQGVFHERRAALIGQFVKLAGFFHVFVQAENVGVHVRVSAVAVLFDKIQKPGRAESLGVEAVLLQLGRLDGNVQQTFHGVQAALARVQFALGAVGVEGLADRNVQGFQFAVERFGIDLRLAGIFLHVYGQVGKILQGHALLLRRVAKISSVLQKRHLAFAAGFFLVVQFQQGRAVNAGAEVLEHFAQVINVTLAFVV